MSLRTMRVKWNTQSGFVLIASAIIMLSPCKKERMKEEKKRKRSKNNKSKKESRIKKSEDR